MENDKIVKPFGFKDKIGYMFGDFGNDMTFLLSSSFLMKFYTDVMDVDGYIVGIIMMIARFVDAFTDVAMGRICDKSKMTPAGKFKPWIRRMCGPVAIVSFLMYQSSLSGLPKPAKIAYLFVTYILWGSVFYTSINIPYGSMASAISDNPNDRQSLSTFRTMGGMFAGAIIMAVVPLLIYNKENGNVTVTVNPLEKGASVSVKDTGIGIPKKYQERIFERFFRVDKSRSKATGGTGLGLAIVKHITQLHDAKLEISSEEGKGTEIIVTFKD